MYFIPERSYMSSCLETDRLCGIVLETFPFLDKKQLQQEKWNSSFVAFVIYISLVSPFCFLFFFLIPSAYFITHLFIKPSQMLQAGKFYS